ncbi:MAG: hypothetical protein M0R40_00860 [Firmicutes bacterium]|nr:hypothetical protein [Bacillota bacterium]
MSFYNVANLNLKFENIASDYVTERMSQYVSKAVENPDITISYHGTDKIILPEGKKIKGPYWWNWIKSEDGKHTAFQRCIDPNMDISLFESDSDWKKTVLQLKKLDYEYGVPTDKRFFTCAGEVFTNALIQHGGFVLHSSAVAYNGKCVLFSAPSGHGKSTHAALWKKYNNDAIIVNDDTPAIRFVGGVPFVFGTPWSGKTWINENISVPLEAIIFISQSEQNSITRCSGAKAVSLMLSEIRKPVFPEMMSIVLNLVDRVLNKIPVYCLSCNISKDAVDLVKKTVGL